MATPTTKKGGPMNEQGGSMNRTRMSRVLGIAAVAALTIAVAASRAQAPAAKGSEMGHVVVTIYRAAPGKQADLLRWLAAQDAAAREAGIAPTQLYAHSDGDSWDYV